MPKDYSHITLLVDMDDTIENLLPAWAEWLNKKHGTSVKADDITGWDVQEFFPSLTKDEVYAPLYEDEFWGTVQPKEDAVNCLTRLNELGFKLYICTNSNYQTIRRKLEYIIDRYFPFISWWNVITIRHKQLLNADILVDDGVHNLIGGSYKKILMTASHNKDFGASSNDMIRVNDWYKAFDVIMEISNTILETKQ